MVAELAPAEAEEKEEAVEAEAEAEEEEEVVVKQLPAKKQRVRKPKHGAKEKKKALQEEEVEGGVGDDE